MIFEKMEKSGNYKKFHNKWNNRGNSENFTLEHHDIC